MLTYLKTTVAEDVASLSADVSTAVSDVNSKVAAVDEKVGTVAAIATKAANVAIAAPLEKALGDVAKVEKSLEAVSAAAAKAGKVDDVTKVQCKGDDDLGKLGYDTKTGVVTVCHKAAVEQGKTAYLMNSVGTPYTAYSKLTSFGIVSSATGCKNPKFQAYNGAQPAGPNSRQFTRVTCTGCSQRPGGMTYTDLVLVGDFVITFRQYDGAHGDGYNMWSFFPEEYTGYTHSSLQAWGLQNFWGVYSNPGCRYDVSWDGSERREGRKRVGRFCDTTRYVSFVRTNGQLSLYESKKAPGKADVTVVMTKRNTWVSKYTKPVRLGMFMHDQTDWIEVYEEGTSIKVKA